MVDKNNVPSQKGNLQAQNYYPVSQLFALKYNATNGAYSFYDYSTKTEKTEIDLLKENSKFFKSDKIKNLEDNYLYKRIIFAMLKKAQKVVAKKFVEVDAIGETPSRIGSAVITDSVDFTTFSEKMHEATEILLSYCSLEIRRQERLVYQNDLKSISYDDIVNILHQGTTKLDVKIVLDNNINNYKPENIAALVGVAAAGTGSVGEVETTQAINYLMLQYKAATDYYFDIQFKLIGWLMQQIA